MNDNNQIEIIDNNQSLYESSMIQLKSQLHQTNEMITQFYIQLKQLQFTEPFVLETIPQLIEKITSIENDNISNALKFGEISKIIKSFHFDF